MKINIDKRVEICYNREETEKIYQFTANAFFVRMSLLNQVVKNA